MSSEYARQICFDSVWIRIRKVLAFSDLCYVVNYVES